MSKSKTTRPAAVQPAKLPVRGGARTLEELEAEALARAGRAEEITISPSHPAHVAASTENDE